MLFNLFDPSTWEAVEFNFNLIFALILALIFIVYLVTVLVKDRRKITVYDLCLVAIFVAMSYVLSLFKLVDFPQGGGITLVQFLPLLILTLITNQKLGILGGLVFGILGLFGGHLYHPIQIVFDYILPPLAISMIGINGAKTKKQLVINMLITFVIFISSMCLSGATFFASYAPSGMNVWAYSIAYNVTGSGVDLIITFIVLLFFPIERIKAQINTKRA